MKTICPAIRFGCLYLAIAALVVPAAVAQMQQSAGAQHRSAPAAIISSVAITQAEQHSSVRVEGKGNLEYRAARLEDPERLVLDFAGTRLAVRQSQIPGVAAPVRGVRLGQFKPDVARVVIELTAAAPYQISRDGRGIVILFTVPQDAAPTGAIVPRVTAAPALRKSHFQLPAPTPRRKSAPGRLTALQAPKMELPRELTQPSVVLASFRGGNGAGTQPTPPAAPQQPSGGGTMASGGKASVRYTGEPISVNLKDVDLKDFFRLVHEISGLNIVLDPMVKGSLTIVLDEVPWDQALDIVLQNNGLDKELSGNVLRIATRDTLKKEAQDQQDLAKAQAGAIDMVTVTRVLSYAKASGLRDTLKRFLSTRGDILADERSNQLIIRDIPQVIPTLDNLIRQLDKKSQQVEIEARVVQATRSFSRDIGTQLAFSGSTTGGRSLFGSASDPNLGVSPFGTTTPTATVPAPPVPPIISAGSSNNNQPFAINLGAASPTSGFGFFHRSPNFAIDFMITAAEAKGVGKLLSKPKLITQNNEKATIKQGTKIPIQTVINNTISTQYVDAVLQLQVTPQVTAEGTVFMDVLVENTQIDNGIPRVQGIPALDTQSAETKVTVADGGTVVIGGVIISQSRVDITQVPWAGSIPLIGHLFKRNNTSIQSQELLFFLTPRIIPG
jgi:type IV pilus assembly protein PilQ